MSIRLRTAALAPLLLVAAAALSLDAQPSAPPRSAPTAPTAPQPSPTARRGVTAEDYFAFTFVADPRLSPDGSQVAYVVSRVDRARNRRVPSIWLVPATGGAPRQLVDESWTPGAPRWSPDGRTIAFTSGRVSTDSTGTTGTQQPAPPTRAQLWTVAVTGGTPRRISNHPNGVSSCAWAPDGTRFVCLVRTGPSDSLNKGPERSDVRHYSHITYKFNDTGWFDDKRSHLWIFDAAGCPVTAATTATTTATTSATTSATTTATTTAGTTGSSGAAAPAPAGSCGRQLTSGDEWNDTEPEWSPDGTRLAFVSDRTGKEYDEAWTGDVWTVTVGGGSLTKLSAAGGRNRSPAWSPDGRTVAFLGAPTEDDPPMIYLASSDGTGPVKVASKELDLIPGNLQWGDDGRALYFESGARGELHAFRVDLATGRVRPVTSGARGVRAVNVHPTRGRMVYLANDFRRLDDVYVANTDGRGERRLTDANGALWKSLDLASVQRMTYKGADGWDIDGFFVKPLGWTPGKRYPMILNIHGGPAAQYGVDWYHEFQVYAAQGYAVFFTNPRGSTGYGRAFQRGIENEWGGKDYVDVMNGVRAVLAANPWIDTTRLGVTGGSYGGYLTNWIVGHTSMFKAAVTLRSVTNFVSDEGTRDGAYGHKRDFGGDLFEKFDLYWERSPLKYAKDVTTPILVLHSENDLRVPLEQGEQWFRALKHFGKTAEFVIFPRENHNLTRTGEPRHLVESLNWQLYWFDRYLNDNARAVPPNRRR